MQLLEVHRYLRPYRVGSALDRFSDVLEWLKYLTSPEYVKDVLVQRHSLTPKQADGRLRHIVPHVGDAISFIEQARSGPEEVSFLPAYYAVLNLAKVYVLLGPRHADLPDHRWHGATYDVNAKSSHSVRTEIVTLRTGGALPLLYETLTGQPVNRDRTIMMGDVYSWIPDISAEYYVGSGDPERLASLDFGYVSEKGGFRIWVSVRPRSPRQRVGRSDLPCLGASFTRVPKEANRFVGPVLQCPEAQLRQELESHIRPQYLCHSDNGRPIVALQGSRFPMPEEFPIALLFFHMSSVVRYKPEFLRKVQESRWWPLLTAARRHSLFSFMVLFWSFVHKEQLLLGPAGAS